MSAKKWEDLATQLASEANRGRQTLEAQETQLSLKDFKPNNDVLAVLTQYAHLLLSHSSLDAETLRQSLAEFTALHSQLCLLAESIQEQLFPRPNRRAVRQKEGAAESGGAGSAVNEDHLVGKGKEPAAVGKEEPTAATKSGAVLGQGAETVSDRDLIAAECKTRRVLWYNWYFVACLITFIQSRLPHGSGIPSWRSAKAVLVANGVVNHAFRIYGASAFYVLDCYSAIQYLLSKSTLLHLQKSRDVAIKAAISFPLEYEDFFPPGLELVYCPAFLIAEKTGCPLQDVCYAIGLGEVGDRLKHISLPEEGVDMCMAIKASVMEKDLVNAEPLCSSAIGPASAGVVNTFPITSFGILGELQRALYDAFETR